MIRFFTKDKVFMITLILTIVSMFFVTPHLGYYEYINFKVLIVMFSLMIGVLGMYETHFFDYVATFLVMRFKNIKWIAFIIVSTTFFLAMFMTNDAVLLTLIPFSMFVLKYTKQEQHIITILIMQTIAANLGSALTPMGDPQNIYLYTYFDIPIQSFLRTMLPITLSGFILISMTVLWRIPNSLVVLEIMPPKLPLKRILLYALILINAILCVLRVIPDEIALLITSTITFIFARHLFKGVDYQLLFTFLCFFILTGNLRQIEIFQPILNAILDDRHKVYFSGLIVSQLISNVPAAVLLSTFTDQVHWQALLQGVNVGSMGTIIASLASLITFKYLINHNPKLIKKYLLHYAAYSMVFIVIITTIIFIL